MVELQASPDNVTGSVNLQPTKAELEGDMANANNNTSNDKITQGGPGLGGSPNNSLSDAMTYLTKFKSTYIDTSPSADNVK